MKMKYFAGFTNEWHTHNCAHGMYVLDARNAAWADGLAAQRRTVEKA